jgi:hypothetical protein
MPLPTTWPASDVPAVRGISEDFSERANVDEAFNVSY